jgi:hypothetical protein
MATNVTGSRASRRSAATAARAAAASAPTPVEAPEVLSDVMDADIDEAFGVADATPKTKSSVKAPESAANSENGSGHRGGGEVAATTPSAGTSVALPMAQSEDLTRKIESADIVIPKLRISQAMSKANTLAATSGGSEGVPMGNWYQSSANKNLGKTVYFIPVDMRKSRAYFVQGQGLMCRSFDMLQGEGDPGVACEGTLEEMHTLPESQRGCPLRLWKDRVPPPCGKTYHSPGLLVSDVDGESTKAQPVLLQLRGSATPAALKINTLYVNDGGGSWPNMILELGIDSKSNTKGTFFVPTVEFFDTTDAPEFARIRRRALSMADQMGAASLRSSIEDDAE